MVDADELIIDDDLLVKKILQGRNNYYEILVKKYQNKIFQLIYRMTNSQDDALDLTQDTFLKAYNSLSQFKNQSSFYTWLYRIASNKTLDFLRKQRRVKNRDEKILSEHKGRISVFNEKHNPEQKYLKKERNLLVQEAINNLPDKYAVAIILNHYQELTYQEIAEVLELPVKTVSTRIYRGRMLLKEKLLKGGREHEL